MAIAVESTDSANVVGGTTMTMSTWSGGVSENSLLISGITSSGPIIDDETGWTKFPIQGLSGVFGGALQIRLAPVSFTTVTFDLSSSANGECVGIALSGVDTTNPYQVYGPLTSDGSESVTPVIQAYSHADDCWAVGVSLCDSLDLSDPGYEPTGYTPRVIEENNQGVAIATKALGTGSYPLSELMGSFGMDATDETITYCVIVYPSGFSIGGGGAVGSMFNGQIAV